MHVLVTGAAGMVGRKLTERLAREGQVAGRSISRLTLTDVVPPSLSPALPPELAGRVEARTEDFADPATAAALIAPRPDLIFHLAAIISGEAERDFDKGYRVNLDGTRALLEAIRHEGGRAYVPKLVFTTSSGVFGAPYPTAIPDEFHVTPLTSYGTQKAIGELLLADYARRGFLDGVGIRFPSIVVRPGKPNASAGGFFSGIIREPLQGVEALLPVADDTLFTHASPRSAVGFLIHAAGLTREALGPRINLSMPGVCVTVGEQIEALRRVAGDKAVKLIRRAPDKTVTDIVAGWPARFDTARATALGFRAERDFDEIIRVHIEDDLGGRLPN
ncbi:Nucleoside-diphosphate-sugar epimerase [Bosea sp. OK403]|uniref:D-erythronate dehydrogenase n=1 Tax=Bosea sp. OK403 TaxID=1855286 RepID=UPI0008E998B6|nr:D-erythronate dehydrogenase [Bosea sp. OK403]SFJ01302.1 Nucleoside-diphosphate-sugar epimerase [Bosea sp. OK403]